MDLVLLRLFQRQVADQCKVLLTGVGLINEGLQAGDQDRLWIGVQTSITGAGNVSKALWGQNKRYAAQRQSLRDSLAVTDDSLFSDVSMRNHFEHYDERLDRWWKTSRSHNHLDRMIGSPDLVAGLEDGDRFRVYDNATHDVVFWGERFNLQSIAAEAERIGPIAEQEALKPHWQPSNSTF